jgi:hypothetical protein
MKYPDNYKQAMPENGYAQLPEYAEYDGSARDLIHLRGLEIPTKDVERVIYIGERENVFVILDDRRVYPWRSVWIQEYDADGNPVIDGYTNAPPLPADTGDPRAYSTAHIASLGMTDARLAELAEELLDETWEPAGPGPSLARREMYDRVLDKLIGDG